MRRVFLTAGLVAAIVATIAATAADATAPGKNGRIVFRRYLAPHESDGTIFTIDVDGRNEQRVLKTPAHTEDGDPDWSPDGTRIVFRREYRADGAIYTVRPNGSGLTRISDRCESSCEENFSPAFSPDGKTIGYASYGFDGGTKWAIVLVGPDGTKSRIEAISKYRGELEGPQFSPDGKRLVFVRRNYGRSRPKNGRAVFVANVDGTGTRQVTPWALDGGDDPDWSPDGRWILFRSGVDGGKQSQIYVVHPDGSGLTAVTHFKPGTTVTSSSFSPDGKWIAFGSSGVDGNADVYVMRADGTGMRPVTRTALWDSAPDWGPER